MKKKTVLAALVALMLSITVANANPTGNNVNSNQAIIGHVNIAQVSPDIGQNGLLISASKEENGALLKAFKIDAMNGTYADIALNVSGLNTNTIADNTTSPPAVSGAFALNTSPPTVNNGNNNKVDDGNMLNAKISVNGGNNESANGAGIETVAKNAVNIGENSNSRNIFAGG